MNYPIIIHTNFDFLAVLAALLSGWLVYKWKFEQDLPDTAAQIGTGYFLFLSTGSIVGAYLFGTINLYLSGVPEIGRSILGALFGATLMVELYKFKRGTLGSTGYIYVVPFTVCVIIGRIGCLLSGTHDQTYGIATKFAWGWDYGDDVLRHPVQLYESLSMMLFLICIIIMLKYCQSVVVRYGFYLCVGFYASQRFMWEFLKPYGEFIRPLNIFQILSIILLLYSVRMILKARHGNKTT